MSSISGRRLFCRPAVAPAIETLEGRLLLAGHAHHLAAAPALPAGWTNTAVNALGHSSASSGTFTVAGGGADIGGTGDGFDYAYRALNGDGTMIAHVAGQQNTDPAAKAGIMIRENLGGGSVDAGVYLEPDGSANFIDRTQAGAASNTVSAAFPTAAAPTGHGRAHKASTPAGNWLALTRKGSTVTAYASADGTHWTQVATADVSMAANIYIGLAVTSHNPAALSQCTFDHVTVRKSVALSHGSTSPKHQPSGETDSDDRKFKKA